MTRAMAVMLCAALGSGCFNVTYQNPTLPPNGVVHEGTSSFFLFALVGDEHVPVYQMCPGGVASIETGLSFGDLVLSVITLGIYTPRSYEVACGGGR